MGRVSSLSLLPAEHQELVYKLLRQPQHLTLDQIVAALKNQGVKVSRATLGRARLRLDSLGEPRGAEPGNLVIVLLERDTGATATLASAMSIKSVVKLVKSRDKLLAAEFPPM